MFTQKMQIIRVLIPVVKLFPLLYKVPDKLQLKIGDLIVIPFKNRKLTAIVCEINATATMELREVYSKIPIDHGLTKDTLNFIQKAGDYYIQELGSITKLVLPVDISQLSVKVHTQNIPNHFNLPKLSDIQQKALYALQDSSKPTILQGVTGSGKTEVYFHLIASALQQSHQALLMLPEIALSHQMIERFIERFGFTPAIWNSKTTTAQKKSILIGIISGDIKMVIGTRSSLFLPYKNLKLIVVDEEHDASYKQDNGVLYNARDMAILRAYYCKIKIILCSATPSIETIYNVYNNKYNLLKLESRYTNVAMPTVEVIDIKKNKHKPASGLSNHLIKAIQNNLNNKEQVLLFLNRRGYAPLMLCNSCGYRFMCDACSAWLVLHKTNNKIECHHCGNRRDIPKECPDCLEKDHLLAYGFGIERIEEEIRQLFPTAIVFVISRDTKIEEVKSILDKMQNNKIDILIGTQIITKGYHFPNLTLVGVIDADIGLMAGDLRAIERNYQLLHQVGGRAGRENKQGKVLLQTYCSDNSLFDTLKNQKHTQFIQNELEARESWQMPPITRMVSIIFTGKDEDKLLNTAKQFAKVAPEGHVQILGPAKGIISKIANYYRYRILLITNKNFNVQQYIKFWLTRIKIPTNCSLKIDVDPQRIS